MIEHKVGDLFKEDAEALVNSVNCVGVMGRGIALQFKNVFPENFKAYAAACKREEVQPGRMFVFETGQLTNPRYIINFPTKRHWRGRSRMGDIEAGLAALVGEIRELGIHSIALPPLGSDLGGLSWADVRPRIEEALGAVGGVRVVVFEPGSEPADGRPNLSTDAPGMTPVRAALVVLIRRYLDGLLDPFVTLLEIHKLMYFLERAGEPLKLRFTKAQYGPYAENLRHVMREIEGHYVSGYRDGGDDPRKRLELVPGAVDDAAAFLASHAETRERLDRVVELVDGFESSFGLELLSTVHWVATEESATADEAVIERVYAWDRRKQRFSERQIRLALNVLREKGWLEPA